MHLCPDPVPMRRRLSAAATAAPAIATTATGIDPSVRIPASCSVTAVAQLLHVAAQWYPCIPSPMPWALHAAGLQHPAPEPARPYGPTSCLNPSSATLSAATTAATAGNSSGGVSRQKPAGPFPGADAAGASRKWLCSDGVVCGHWQSQTPG